MTIVFPEAVKARGNTSLVIVQDIAVTSAPDLSTEINAVTSVNASFYFLGFSAAGTTNKGSAPARLGSTQLLQEFGDTTYEVTDIQFVYNPQEDSSDDANLVKAALVEGTDVWLVERNGSAATTAIVAGDIVNLHHVKLGLQNRTKTGDGEFDQLVITQSCIYVEPPFYDKTVVA